MNMTQEDRQLLFKDLCARLPYGVKTRIEIDLNILYATITGIIYEDEVIVDNMKMLHINKVFPYLRPMESMTDEEEETYEHFLTEIATDEVGSWEVTDWLNAHYFDYRGLIAKGLAIEAPVGMYEIN